MTGFMVRFSLYARSREVGPALSHRAGETRTAFEARHDLGLDNRLDPRLGHRLDSGLYSGLGSRLDHRLDSGLDTKLDSRLDL
jgi:hypothetical protein